MSHIFSILISTLGHQFEHAVPLISKASTPLSPQPWKPAQPAELTETPDFVESIQTEKVQNSDQQCQVHSELSSQPLREPSKTILLNLPADILFLISDHLSIASVHALSLTCRGFYSARLPQTRRKLDTEDKKELLITLERDRFGDGFYFCHRCTKLHTYRRSYGPHSVDEGTDKTQGYICGMRDRFSPVGNTYDLGYHHTRLVMNSHFYGPEHGIPLENICILHEARREKVTVRCSTSANILKDELFLRRTYTFTVTNTDAPAFRRCTGHRDFRLCEHLPFFRNSSIYHQAIPELQRRPRANPSRDELVPCTKSPGSCGLCLLDYDISIARLDQSDAWSVTIDAYHQLGDCRSPDDWKWARFTEKNRPHLFLPNRPNRRGSGYNPGAVKKAWLQGAAQGPVDGNTAHLKAKTTQRKLKTKP